ncbi:MAG: hypothetical protein JJ920_09190 [Roseitalea sp.]|jgi:hypothetical protein|nr:hypothetical protein [Roseitalea sp.]MBO6721902.1 hypothetical protein [Roseitalea sp.]MBO6743073.1 hypothetical protein [Roseitalea sp.]
MAHYRTVVIHPETGGEGRYDFEASEGLMDKSPVKVLRHFMEIVDRQILPAEHVDYELNAAMKSDNGKVVTGMGIMILDKGAQLPFVAMISERSG